MCEHDSALKCVTLGRSVIGTLCISYFLGYVNDPDGMPYLQIMTSPVFALLYLIGYYVLQKSNMTSYVFASGVHFAPITESKSGTN